MTLADNRPEDQAEIIQTLTEVEESIGRLYDTYSKKQPEHEEFWFGLALEEADHSNLIHSLLNKVRKGSASFITDKKLAGEITTFRDYLKGQQARAKQENMSFIDALQVAIDIEKSLIKQGFFRLIENASPDFYETLGHMSTGSDNLLRFLQRELDKQRKRE